MLLAVTVCTRAVELGVGVGLFLERQVDCKDLSGFELSAVAVAVRDLTERNRLERREYAEVRHFGGLMEVARDL
jgi:hypothetical protein